MAKISPVSIKYNITADFASEGPVEKTDVIGALFGQTEGLLGSDFELRELQKEGKIGRIDVELTSQGGKTTGEIIIPSALDKTQTTIIAASLETIDKIGPTDAKITVKEIEDVRGAKRDYIMERAKKLLAGIKNAGMETKEMHQEIQDSAKTSKITEYGDERLPAGDLTEHEVIVVEGRADVVNLLRCGVKNVIGMNGTRLPAEIAKLGQEKELTLFVDGDRGGKLIAKNVCDNAKVAFIAVAPDGKEVEELTGKEVLLALRRKVTAADFFKFDRSERPERFERNDRFNRDERPRFERSERFERNDRFNRDERQERRFEPATQEAPKVSSKALAKEDKDKLRKLSDDLGGKNVLILDESLNVLHDVSVSKLSFMRVEKAYILLTSNASSSVIMAAENFGAKYVAAKTFGKVEDAKVELISL